MATKSISLSGIITEQTIHKQFNAGDFPIDEKDPLDSTSSYTDNVDGSHVSVFNDSTRGRTINTFYMWMHLLCKHNKI